MTSSGNTRQTHQTCISPPYYPLAMHGMSLICKMRNLCTLVQFKCAVKYTQSAPMFFQICVQIHVYDGMWHTLGNELYTLTIKIRKDSNPRRIKMLDGATVVPGSLVVKPVFYSHCYADSQI